MIYVTGDTHGDIDFLKLHIFAENHPELSRDDYVIIAGDFGGIWSEFTMDRTLTLYEKLPFTVLFVDGNHENFDILNSFPIEEWRGGKIHRIRPNIIHLMRGQVFTLEGKTIFTFGGATSIDKFMRRENISWWEAELPTGKEVEEGISNLEKYNNQVDYIITHSCDERTLYYPPLKDPYQSMKIFPENRILSIFADTVKFKHWYFGHFHMDAQLNEEKTVLYQEIVELL